MNTRIDEYLKKKRIEVLEAIDPICKAFNISDYDYEVYEDGNEILRIYKTRIGCCSNSVFAVKQELVGYLFVCYWKGRYLPFRTQCFNRIKEYWKK